MTKNDLATILTRTSLALAHIEREVLDDHDDAVVLAAAGILAVMAEAVEADPEGDELALLVWLALETDGATDGHATLN